MRPDPPSTRQTAPRVLGGPGARQALDVLGGIGALDDVGAIFPALRAAATVQRAD